MTKTDKENIAILQTQMINLDSKMEEGFSDIKEDISRIEKTLNEFIEHSETKFAFKWVEQGAKWALTLVIGAVIVALLSLTLKQ